VLRRPAMWHARCVFAGLVRGAVAAGDSCIQARALRCGGCAGAVVGGGVRASDSTGRADRAGDDDGAAAARARIRSERPVGGHDRARVQTADALGIATDRGRCAARAFTRGSALGSGALYVRCASRGSGVQRRARRRRRDDRSDAVRLRLGAARVRSNGDDRDRAGTRVARYDGRDAGARVGRVGG